MGQRGACARKRPFDVHRLTSLTCSARFSYGSPSGSAVPIGEIGGGRERPPFLLPGSGTGVLRNSHLRNTPWGGRSRPLIPADCFFNFRNPFTVKELWIFQRRSSPQFFQPI